MAAQQKTTDRIDQAIDFLKNSTQQLSDGRLVSLDAFQESVRSICDDVAKEPVADKEAYSAKLQVLADFLRDFEKDLCARQAEVNFELMNLNAKQKALKSYENVTHSTPGSKKEEDDNGN